MKISKILHMISIIFGLAGMVALIGVYIAGPNGTVLGMTQDHLFKDASVHILVAIWLQIATIHHMKLEEKGELI